jgi:filamentous hemagglutinin
MNKLRYRLVFNKLRGQQMVVAETARAAGKGAGADCNLPAPGHAAHPLLRQLAQALARAFSVSLLLAGGAALAQVVGDPGAPRDQRPTVLNAANGVTVVNIQTASGAGVSRNTYTQFDVPKGGVILNNSRTDAQTQLGGWVQANPWLAKGQARVILNEVNSSSPSRLQGFVEVAGQRAEVIIANPSGIAVDGGGFINVSRATLTTGSARFSDGRIDGFTVARGQISIDGAGLDASSTDYTALIARSVAINAALWAQHLNVLTGPGEVTVAGDTVDITAKAGQEGAPAYAIDVSRLGGMYANKIFLVGSEAGVGVRNAGNIGAAAGELVVTADGRLENTGQLAASTQLRLNGRAVDNSGSVAADGNVTVTGATVKNSGAIRSAGTAQVAAQGDFDNSAGTVEAARLDLASATGSLLNRGGKIIQGGSAGLDMASATLRNADGGQVGAAAPAVGTGIATAIGADAGGGTAPAAGAATPGTVTATAAPVLANGVLRAAQAIDNSGGTVTAGGAITLATSAIDNSGGKLYLPELAFNGTSFINRAGTVEVTRQLRVTTPWFDNSGGSIVAGSGVDARVGAFGNSAGVMRAASVRVDATGAIDNRSGVIQAAGPLGVTTAGMLDNQAGAIEVSGAGSTFDVRASAIDSTGGRLVNHGVGATNIVASTLLNTGVISAGGALGLHAAALSNAGGSIVSGSSLVIDADGLDNSGVISSAGTLNHAGASLRNTGNIVAAGAMRLTAANIDNDGGELATAAGSSSALLVDTHTLSNRSGTMMADGAVHIAASGSVDNAGGLLQGASEATLAVAGTLANADGAIEVLGAAGQLSIQAGSLDNDIGRIVNAGAGATQVHSAGGLNNSGVIQGGGTLDVLAATLQQSATGQVLSGAGMQVSATRFDNAGAIGSHGAFTFDGGAMANSGQLIASGPVTVRATMFDNSGGQVATTPGAGGAVTITGASLSNRGGSISADGAIDATVTGAVDNNGGKLQSTGDVRVAAGGAMTNDGGSVEAAGANLAISAGSLSSLGGRIVQVGTGNASIASASSFINSGLIAGNGAVVLGAGTFDNQAGGSIAAATTLDLQFADLLRSAGAIASNGALTFNQAGATFSNSGTVNAGGALTFNLAQLRNDGGALATDGALSVQAQTLSNRAGAIASQGAANLALAGAFDNTGGTLRSNQDLQVQAGGLLGNNSGIIETGGAGSTMQLHAAAIDSLQGRIVNAGSGATIIKATGDVVNSGLVGGNGRVDIEAAGLDNRSGATVSAGQALALTARQLDNAGAITARAALALQADTLNNSGQVAADAAITVHTGAFNNDGGQVSNTLHAGAGIEVSATSLSNRGGSIVADTALNLAVAGAVDNSAGQIQANGTLAIHAQSIGNEGGRIANAGSGATTVASTGDLSNGGLIQGAGALTLSAQSLHMTAAGKVASGADMLVTASQDFVNAGVFGSQGTLRLDGSGAAVSNSGQIVSAGAATVLAGQLANDGGQIATGHGLGADLTVLAGSITNVNGAIIADGAATITSGGAFDNHNGAIAAANQLAVQAGGTLNNDAGVIDTQGSQASLTVSAQAIGNAGGRIVNAGAGATSIRSAGSFQNSGTIGGNGAVLLLAATLDNQAGGTISAASGLDLGVTDSLNNAGSIGSNGALTFDQAGASFTNTGAISVAGPVILHARSVSNRGGAIEAIGNIALTSSGGVDNTSGALHTGGDLALSAGGSLLNDGGAIETAGPASSMHVQAGAVSNLLGRIVNAGQGATTVNAANSLVSSGTVAGNGALAIDAQVLDNRTAGTLSAGAGLLIASGQQLHNAGVISAHDALTIQAASAAMDNSGKIVAGATATISADALHNDGGQIATSAGSGADVLLNAHSLTNVNGTVLADRDAFLAITGDVDNRLGAIQAANALQLAAGGALNNTSGAIEDGGANASMRVAAQSIDNTAGRIVNAGTGATTVNAATSLVSSGVVAGNGAVSIQAATMDNASGAKLSAGGALDLAVTQRFTNYGALSSAGALTFNQAGAQFGNGGTIVAGADATINAAAIDNRGGQLVTIKNSGAALLLTAGSIANHGGVLLADGRAALASSSAFDNTSGIVQAGSSLSLNAGGVVSNDGGAIETLGAASTLTLGAGALANGSGRISNTGNGATTVSSQSSIVNNGLIAGNGGLGIHAATLVNQAQGSIGSTGNLSLGVWQQLDNQGQVSSAGALNFNQGGASFNNSGKIASNAAMTITAAAINNNGGQLSTVRGVGGDIVISGALANRGGQVLADGNAFVHVLGGLDNSWGTLQASRALSLDASGTVVNNSGAIEALGTGSTLTVQAGAIDNTGGRIVNLGYGDSRLSAGNSIVNTGTIGGNGNVWLWGQSLVNGGGGVISAGAGLDLGINQSLENWGAISSTGTLTFNQGSAQLVNRDQVMAGGSMLVNAAAIDNRGGKISTGLGSGADLALSAQSINNDGGRIVADRDLRLTAGQLLGNGEAGAGRDLSASLQGDFVNTAGAPRFTAQRDLALAISGNFTNAATFAAVRNLSLSAAAVNNLQGAKIEAQGVTIRPAGGLANAGEINGAGFLDIATGGAISNTGAMVGGALGLSANSINNDGATALLGATSSMQLLAAGDINNRGGATIYSAGWLAAQSSTLNNLSSTVESSGDMAITADTINNIRENVQIVRTVVTDTTTHMTLPSWYTHGDNNNEYDPRSSNYSPRESYFVNPADIISDTKFVTPDGYEIGRVEYRTHANDSAFFAAGSGQYGKYGHRDRITTTDGTRVLYYLSKDNNVANPDQGGASGNGNPLFDSTTMIWNGPAVTYSSQYGSCSTTCVRYTTVPGYDDPTNTIGQNTIRQLAGSLDRLEIYRDAHHTATEDSLAPGAGAVARIVAGGSMTLTVSQLLNNQYGDIMASGFLKFDGGGRKVNEGATLYRNHTFDGKWTTENHTVTAYTMPSIAEIIGSVGGVISGTQGVSITGQSFSNIDVTAGTVGIVRSSFQVLGSGASGAVSASSGAAGSGHGNQAALQGGFAGLIANGAAAAGNAGSSWNGAAGAAMMHGGAAQADTAGLVAFQDGGHGATGAFVTAGAAGAAGQVANVHGGGLANLAAGALHGAQSAGANQSGAASTAAAGAPVGGSAVKLGAGSVLTISPSGLFTRNPDANGKYLYETRSQFANLNTWASSDFLLTALGVDPAVAQKRLGDGFYEQRMVREQMNELTGRAPANGASDDSVYQALLANAVSSAKQLGLRPGIALTADQVSALTSDIVWMESQQVKLPDGSVDTVLVPKVYLAHLGDGAVTPGGALVTAGGAGVSINVEGDIVNRGGVIDGGSGRTLLVSGQDILNQGGTIRGGDVLLAAARDVRNESLASTQTYSSVNTSGSYTALSNQASIVASGALQISAGRDITDVAGHISAANAGLTAGRDVNFNVLATGSTYVAQVGQDAQNNLTVGHALSRLNTTGDLVVSAGRDLTLSGAQLAVGGNGALLAGRALTVASVMDQVKTDQHGDASAKNYEKRAADDQTVVGSSVSAGSALQLAAGIKETAALTVSSSALASTGALSLSATGNVLIGGVQENHVIDNASKSASSSTFTKKSSSSTDYVASSTLVGSSVNAGAISVKAGNDVIVTGSALTAQDALAVIAGRDLVVASGQQTVNESHSAETKKSGFSVKPAGFGYSKAEQQQNGASSTTTQLGSTISGGTVTAVAGRDLSVIASNVVADGAVVLAGTRDVNIVSAQNTTDSTSASSSKKSGSIGSSWQPAIGTVKTTEQGTSQSVTQAGSQVASLGGNVTIEAGERYTQTASNVIAPGGNIAIIAKDVQITAGYDTASSDSQSTFSKTAVGMTVSVPIVSTVQGIASLASAAKQAGSDRMTALAAVTAGMQVKDAYNNVTAAGDPAGIKIGVSLGTSKSESSTTQSSSTAVGSQVKAGGDVTIVATGGGAGSNITSIGSDISGGGNVTLVADNKINILAAENTSSQHSSNSSSGASIGVTYSMGGAQNGFSLELAANRANGKADGESTTYANSHVSAGNTVNLQSGGDTNIKGGVISASSVVANIGGDLNVQSLQDKAVYDSKQKSASVGISVCLPPACYGASSVSGSLSKAAVNGDFLSVVEQSGIKAGNGGFQLVVHGNTDLIGGVISSSQAAIDQGKNSLATGSLTYTELKNKDVYEASSFAMSGSVSGKFGDQSKAISSADKLAAGGKAAPSATGGFGQDSGNQSSTTASAISAGALTITDAAKQAVTGKSAEQALAGIATGVTTDTAAAQAGALTQAWNGEALMKEVQAQTQITQAFSAQAPRAIADFASRQEKSIKDELKKDPTNVDLQADLAKWGEGGTYRVALHTLSGALSGGVGGALGAMTVAGVAAPLNQLQAKIVDVLVQQGMSPEAARMASQAVAEVGALGTGALVGGMAGGATALTVDTNNRQLHETEISLAKKYAKQVAKIGGITEEEATARIERQLLRWVNADTFANDGGRVDELVVSTIGITGKDKALGIAWDYKDFGAKYSADYKNSTINIRNIESYSALLSSVNIGKTPAAYQQQANDGKVAALTAAACGFSLGGFCIVMNAYNIGDGIKKFGNNDKIAGGIQIGAGVLGLGVGVYSAVKAGSLISGEAALAGNAANGLGIRTQQELFSLAGVNSGAYAPKVSVNANGYSGLTTIDASGRTIPRGIPSSTTAAPSNISAGVPSAAVKNSGFTALSELTPVSPSNSGGISAGKISGNGYALIDLTVAEQSIAQNVAMNGDPRGAVTEGLMNSVFRRQGMSELTGGQYGSNNGFDHVYMSKDGAVTIILDSKQITRGSLSLSTNGAGGQTQLSDAWVNEVLLRLDAKSPAAIAINDAIINGTLVKGVAGVDRATGKVMVVRVK